MIIQLNFNLRLSLALPQNFNSSFLLKQLEIQDVFRNSSQKNPDNEVEDVWPKLHCANQHALSPKLWDANCGQSRKKTALCLDKGRFGSVLKHRYNTVRGERGQAVIKTERQGGEARPGNSTEEWTLWRTGKNKFTSLNYGWFISSLRMFTHYWNYLP